MLGQILNIPIISNKPVKEAERVKYTKSDALRNVYKAKVNKITKKRG